MTHLIGLGLALAVCAAAEAAETVTSVPAVPAASVVDRPAASMARLTKPLDLRIRDVRNYMMPNEYRAALGAPDADKNTVIVEANRELLPVAYEEPVPGGIVGLYWALKNPTQSWRILVPDLRRPPPGPPDVVPPPIFRWGP